VLFRSGLHAKSPGDLDRLTLSLVGMITNVTFGSWRVRTYSARCGQSTTVLSSIPGEIPPLPPGLFVIRFAVIKHRPEWVGRSCRSAGLGETPPLPVYGCRIHRLSRRSYDCGTSDRTTGRSLDRGELRRIRSTGYGRPG